MPRRKAPSKKELSSKTRSTRTSPAPDHQDTTQSESQQRQWVQEQLVAPWLKTLFLSIPQASKKLKGMPPDLETEWPTPKTLVSAWLYNEGRLDELATFLQENPFLIEHILVQSQLHHLHSLARGFMPLTDFGQGVMDLKQQAAQEELQHLIKAWGEGMLPGWQVTITPQTSTGRQRVYDNFELLSHYKELLQGVFWRLQQQPKQEDEEWLRRRPKETVKSFASRVGKFAQNLIVLTFLLPHITVLLQPGIIRFPLFAHGI